MKKNGKWIALSLAGVVLALGLLVSGCMHSKQDRQEVQTTAQAEKDYAVKMQVNELLSNAQACPGLAPTVGQMINAVFHDYEWSVEPYGVSDNGTEYIVEISGTYSPTPSAPYVSQPGSIQYYVNLGTGETRIYSDPDNLYRIFLIYAVS